MAILIKMNRTTEALPPPEIYLPISMPLARQIQGMEQWVHSVYADGHEHELLVQRLVGIPHGHAFTTWTGEWARFVVANFMALT